LNSKNSTNINETEKQVDITPTKSVLIPLGNGKKLEIITGEYVHDFNNFTEGYADWKNTIWQVIIDTQLLKVDQITGSASIGTISGFSHDNGFSIDDIRTNWLGDQNKIQLALNLAAKEVLIRRINFQIFAYGE